jgi:hypothetical protein
MRKAMTVKRDIVDQLRFMLIRSQSPDEIRVLDEAADEIERLRKAIAAEREAILTLIENELIAAQSFYTSADYKRGSIDTATAIADAMRAR